MDKPHWLTSAPSVGYTHAPKGTPKRKTGARPSSKESIASAPRFKPTMTTVPWWIWLPQKLSSWNNFNYGDCVTAEEAFAKAASGIFISDQEAIRWAQSHGVLNGADLASVLDLMAAKGFEQDGNVYNDGPKQLVDYTNPAVLHPAIQNGPVKIGVASNQLQQVVGNTSGWFATGLAADQNEDHAVTLCGFGTAQQIATALNVTVPAGVDPTTLGYALFTWNTIGFIDRQSMLAITSEAWLRNPTTVIVGSNPPTPDVVWTPTPPTPTPTPPTPTPPTPVPVVGTLIAGSDMPAGQYIVLPVSAAQADQIGKLTPAQWQAIIALALQIISIFVIPPARK